jgi:hypothetical protein
MREEGEGDREREWEFSWRERNETDGNDKKLIGQQTIDTSTIERRFAQ